eukprot:CAMPEP_0173395678 /NCGR_PEP_ID=MMETSP1356-20130122/32942_1 /TAXON_ID=77927 ORGANISM="Hemiselmis virescens, Strain PCC157" /NCGR_SAMPLE_ID=MMETSP1356 /ASSEMBLY_ACC=CAM_ASM_000847 /LENGTH=40 /DNA_ID= /DNA_START= /DNA_END= /DNA_ORIENTATION=
MSTAGGMSTWKAGSRGGAVGAGRTKGVGKGRAPCKRPAPR